MWAGMDPATRPDSVFAVRYVFFGLPRAWKPGDRDRCGWRADGHMLQTGPVTVLVTANEGVSVRVRAEPQRVRRGGVFELIVEVLGGGSLTDLPEIPDVFDYAEHTGSGSGSENSYSYSMRATSVGEFEIPPMRVRVDGRMYETESATLVVTDEPSTINVRSAVHSGVIWVGGEFVVSVEVGGVTELDAEPVPTGHGGIRGACGNGRGSGAAAGLSAAADRRPVRGAAFPASRTLPRDTSRSARCVC